MKGTRSPAANPSLVELDKRVRIPFPERFPIDRVVVFAVVLFVIQQLERTPLYFSAGSVAFIIIAAVAFNTAGGLTRASGAYVFFYSTLVVIVGLCYKALLGEPADSNLRDPQGSIAVYVAGITAMLVAVVVSRRFSRKTGLLQNVLKEHDMYRSCVGSIAFALTAPYIIYFLGASKLNSAFTQLNDLLPLGIIIGVVYEIRRSGGTRSMNFPVAFGMIYLFIFFGVLGFSKQGMLTPVLCWLLPVCANRFRLTALQVISCLLGLFIIFQYLVPYSQYGRRFLGAGSSTSQRIDIAVDLLSHPNETRKNYEETQLETGSTYYNTAQGFWDRLNFISTDDALIDFTDQGHQFGYTPVLYSFLNTFPHFILPDKPVVNFGNVYAHELGGLSEDDNSTGISFSPTAEAYHMGKWVGIFVVAPLIWFLIFVVFDSVFGDLRVTPWGLLVLAGLSHTAPEGALAGAIYFLTYELAAFTFSALFATWVAPAFATIVLGRDRRIRIDPHSSLLSPTRNTPTTTGAGAP
jgi:hypothetical protein